MVVGLANETSFLEIIPFFNVSVADAERSNNSRGVLIIIVGCVAYTVNTISVLFYKEFGFSLDLEING